MMIIPENCYIWKYTNSYKIKTYKHLITNLNNEQLWTIIKGQGSGSLKEVNTLKIISHL